MSKKVKSAIGEQSLRNTYYNYQGGYISYDPSSLTEHYTNKRFEEK